MPWFQRNRPLDSSRGQRPLLRIPPHGSTKASRICPRGSTLIAVVKEDMVYRFPEWFRRSARAFSQRRFERDIEC